MIIGLTGGIGTGKSTVAKILSEKGFIIVDADAISREVTETGSPALIELSDAFGSEIINENGSLNRKLLAAKAFADEDSTKILNDIVTKRIIEISKKRLVGNCVYDAPTLLENHLEFLVDVVMLVTADLDIRIERIMKRDNRSYEEIQSIISKQMPEEEKEELSDIIIYNNGTLEELREIVTDSLKYVTIVC